MALVFKWDGEALCPVRPKLADAELVIGETYLMEPVHERSVNSHRHYFVALSEAWKSLPDDQTDRWPTAEHLRKHALIMTGFRDERTIVAETKAAAQRLAAFVKPMDEHAVISVRECVVRVWTAQSQSMKAMGKAEFQRSKDEVLAFAAGLVGVSPGELPKEAAA